MSAPNKQDGAAQHTPSGRARTLDGLTAEEWRASNRQLKDALIDLSKDMGEVIASLEAQLAQERALVEEASHTIAVLHEQLAQVTAERDALLAACQAFLAIQDSTRGKGMLDLSTVQLGDAYKQARAAIALAGGGK